MTLLFYDNLFQEYEEREERYRRLEENMKQQGLSDSEVSFFLISAYGFI